MKNNKQFTRMQEIAGLINENHEPQDPNTKLYQNIKDMWNDGGLEDPQFDGYAGTNWDELDDIIQAEIVEYFRDDFESLGDNEMDVDTNGETWDYEMTENLKGKMKLSELKSQIREMVLAEKSLKPSKKEKAEAPSPEIEPEMDLGSEESQSTGSYKEIQDALTKAQEGAKQLGDEKLINQIGNTLVYLVRSNMQNNQGQQMNENEPINEESVDSITAKINDFIGEMIEQNLLDRKEISSIIDEVINYCNEIKQDFLNN